MDLLKKELERKKRALELAKIGTSVVQNSDSGGAASRFLNAAQLRRRQEEVEEHLRMSSKRSRTLAEACSVQALTTLDKKSAQITVRASTDAPVLAAVSTTTTNELDGVNAVEEYSKGDSTIELTGASSPAFSGLSTQEITIRLRSMGLPVRLFGEGSDDAARWKRFQAALAQEQVTLASLSEKEEFRLGQGHGIRNPFLPQKVGTVGDIQAAAEATAGSRSAAAKAEDNEDDATDEDDPHKRIYKYLNKLLQQWQDELAQRPESVKQSVAGKNETKTLLQCQDYIRPLFKLLKKRKLEESLTQHLVKIVHYCQLGEFVQANDAYLDVAIGRAAWPIGVTMVGIHARTGRAKIESANVAHVMNSELQRKYLTSVKRLITYAQRRSTADPSKKVLN